MTERILYCVFSRLLYLHFVTMLILDPTALCIFYPGGPTTTASPTLSAQQSSRWVRGRRNTFVGLVLHSSLKSRTPMWDWPCSKFLALHCINLYAVGNPHPVHRNFCRFLLAYGLWNALFVSLENTFEFRGHSQHDTDIETAQRLAEQTIRRLARAAASSRRVLFLE